MSLIPHNRSISRLSLYSLIVVTTLSVLISGFVWIALEQARFMRESRVLKQRYLETQKASSQKEVGDVFELIAFQRSRVEQRIREKLQSRLSETEGLLRGLRQVNGNTASVETMLRSLKPDNGLTSYMLMRTDGTMVFNPIGPQLEGSNVRNLTNRQGRYIYREIIDSVRTGNAVFVRYSWPKPSDPLVEHTRIVYLKRINNMIVGVGEYVDDEESELQKEILARISAIRFGHDGYLFVYRSDGLCLSHIDRSLIGKNRWSLTDRNGVKVVQKIVETGNQPGGGFVEYVATIKPDTGKPADKVAFVRSLPDWNWTIGAGVYFDDIDAVVAHRRTQLYSQVWDHLRYTFLILLICLVLSVWTTRLFLRYINREIDVFSLSFERALKSLKTIEISGLHFSEFERMAKSINHLIEDRRQTERALAESEGKLRAVFESARDAIFIKDTSLRYTFVNRAMGEIFATPTEQFIGHTYAELFPGDAHSLVSKDDHLALSGKEVESEHHMPLSDRTIILHVIKVPLRDAEGHVIGLCGIGRDLTESRRAEMELRQAQKMESIGTLASGIAHDFNNILSAILGYTELATFKVAKNSDLVGNLNEIMKACNRARDLVKQILAFSSRREEEAKPVQMSIVVKDAMKMMRASLPSTIQITMNLESISKVLSDPTQLHQIVVNLCTNAFHAMKAHGGHLTVSLKDMVYTDIPPDLRYRLKDQDYLMFRVSDTGHGIPPEIMERIFEPYFTSKAPDEGTGLGLAIVHRIVENHGGTIRVTSEVNVGTAFEIYLPQAEDNEIPVERFEEGELEITPTRILFVDDEESIVDIVGKNLSYFGYQVTTYNASTEALEAVKAAPDGFDLLITDMTMPNMTGTDLTQAILQINPGMPVILATGFSNNVTLESLKDSGVKELIYKPFDIQALIFLIEKVRRAQTETPTE
jgi:PAS domain S-box-containing protein